MPIILDKVTHIYNKGQSDESIGLKDVSMMIGDGKRIGLIGHTGSGKSTLAQHLNGLIKPCSGHISIDGKDIHSGGNIAELRRKVGLVFQYPEYQLFEETVYKDIAFGPQNLGLDQKEIDKRVRDAAVMAGIDIDKVGERSPFELSGGEKRKAAIAGVLAMRPSVLVLDEPVAGLDPKAHTDILKLLERVNEKWGCTIVLISHDMDDVSEFCEEIYVIEYGMIAMHGTPEQIFSQPERLLSMGLGLPASAELMWMLKESGINVPCGVLDTIQAADAIADILGKN